jgi:hypothetical protein
MKRVDDDIIDALVYMYQVYTKYPDGISIIDGQMDTDIWFNSLTNQNKTI